MKSPATLLLSFALIAACASIAVAQENVHLNRTIPCGLTTGAESVEQYLDEGYSFVTVGYWNDAGISGDVAEALRIARDASGRNSE